MKPKNLRTLRRAIDRLDEQIVGLLNQRTAYAVDIGKVKQQGGKPVYMPAREQQVYAHLKNTNRGPLTDATLTAIYREVMSGTLMLQRPLQVAFFGPVATFTHLASLKKFGSQVTFHGVASITDVFLEVERGRCEYGVVPVENSIEGAVNHTLDMFIESDLKICAEVLLDISHNLLGRGPLRRIKRVYSNPMVFGQCRLWLESNLPGRELIEVSSTTRAAEIAGRQKDSAAIASSVAAQEYRLAILAESIEDNPHNMTRFLVIGKDQTPASGADKTSIVLAIKDRVGALYDLLYPFKTARINLTKIESRPSKRKAWQYYFYVDFNGHAGEPRVQRALRAIEQRCSFFKILGSYPLEK